MGFRFTFTSTHQLLKIDENFAVGGAEYYKNYEAGIGNITPQLAWGMAKDLTDNGIRPMATLDFNFVTNYTKFEMADTVTSGQQVGNSENYFEPILFVGLGGYTFYKNDNGFRASFDVDDTLSFRIYDNEYSYRDGNSFKISNISGVSSYNAATNTYTYAEITYVQNVLTPYLAAQWSGGSLALRSQLRLPLTLRQTEVKGKVAAADFSKGKLESGVSQTDNYLGFAPQLRLAAQWKAISKLSLNIGGRITLSTIGQSTIETSAKGVPTTKRIENYGSVNAGGIAANGETSNQLTLGVTFLPTENLSFEASCGAGGAGSNDISVFQPNNTGLFYFGSILASLKF
jgi:hypothetical protein